LEEEEEEFFLGGPPWPFLPPIVAFPPLDPMASYSEEDLLRIQARLQTAVRVTGTLMAVCAAGAAYYLSNDAASSNSSKKRGPRRPRAVVGTTPGGDDASASAVDEEEKELEYYVITSMAKHTPTSDSDEKNQQMAAQLQGEAVMAVLTPQQQEDFKQRQMGLMQCTSEAEAVVKMQELTQWVQSVMSKEQKEQIEKEMVTMLERFQLQRAQEDYQKAQSEITQYVLDASQRAAMAQAQQEAGVLQQQGQVDRVMDVIRRVQESIESSLSRKQRLQIKATLAVRMRAIYACWMEQAVNADIQQFQQAERFKRMSQEHKDELEVLQQRLGQTQGVEQEMLMKRMMEFGDRCMTPEQQAEVERAVAAQGKVVQAKRLEDFKTHQMVIVGQGAASEVLRPDQAQQALALQTEINLAQGKQDPEAYERAAKALADFMEGALDVDQKATAEAEVAKAEAVLDSHIADFVKKQAILDVGGVLAPDLEKDTKAHMGQLKEKIIQGDEEALAEMKAMLAMMEQMKTEYESLVLAGAAAEHAETAD